MTASSPCIRLCQIDQSSGLCAGCLRSLDEIARWGGMAETERLAIMASLPARRSRLSSPPSGSPA